LLRLHHAGGRTNSHKSSQTQPGRGFQTSPYAQQALAKVKRLSNKPVSMTHLKTKFPSGNELNIFDFKLQKLLHPSAFERVKSSRFPA
jgi:hypothetical protein